MLNTKNVKFVAYLRTKGTHPDKVQKLGQGRARYYFEMSEDLWMKIRMEFDKSNEYKFAQSLEAVMDLAH